MYLGLVVDGRRLDVVQWTVVLGVLDTHVGYLPITADTRCQHTPPPISQRVYTMQPVLQPVVQSAGRNVLNIHSIKRVTSSTVRTAALLWRNDVMSVLAGPLKRCLAGLICIVHPTNRTTGCESVYAICTVGWWVACIKHVEFILYNRLSTNSTFVIHKRCLQPVVRPVVQLVGKCKHRVTGVTLALVTAAPSAER